MTKMISNYNTYVYKQIIIAVMKMTKLIMIISLLFFMLLTSTAKKENKSDNREKNILGINYYNASDGDGHYGDLLGLSWQISEKADDRFLIPYIEMEGGTSISSGNPEYFVSVVAGVSENLFYNKNKFKWLTIDAGAGFIVGQDNNKKSMIGCIGKFGLNVAYKDIIFRWGINAIPSDSRFKFPFVAAYSISLKYAL